jgi:hypothetical protein
MISNTQASSPLLRSSWGLPFLDSFAFGTWGEMADWDETGCFRI